jgi:hypothetical protein
VAHSIFVDSLNNIFIAGGYSSTVDFDPNITNFNFTSNGSLDLFVLKLDSYGNFIWVKSAGGIGNDFVTSLSANTEGDVILTGIFNQSVDFNPGQGVFNLLEYGSGDIFILSLDSSGNFNWVKQIGGNDYDLPFKLLLDPKNGVYVFGTFYTQIDVNPDTLSAYIFNSNGMEDIFILKIEPEAVVLGDDLNFFCERMDMRQNVQKVYLNNLNSIFYLLD